MIPRPGFEYYFAFKQNKYGAVGNIKVSQKQTIHSILEILYY